MNTIGLKSFRISLLFLGLLFFSGQGLAQEIEAKIRLVDSSVVEIEGKLLSSAGEVGWSFADNYADASELTKRIRGFELFDSDRKSVPYRKLAEGEFYAARPSVGWKAIIDLRPSEKITDAAHVSWMTGDQGLLMLADILPLIGAKLNKRSVTLSIDVPNGMSIVSTERVGEDSRYSIADVGNAVFFLGRDFDSRTKQVDKSELRLLIGRGGWQFSTDEAMAMAETIIAENLRVFGEVPKERMSVIVLPFPQQADPDRWRAETRGSTIVLISGATQLRSVALQRLHEQLRHELAHFWVPNSLNLTGNYDWFYEGFTLYYALKTGVELNQIRFEDFLNTIGRAYDLTQIVSETQSMSLIEASERRWETNSNFLYAKGMVVAFLCDVAMIKESGGRKDLRTLLRNVFQKYRGAAAVEANQALTETMRSYSELGPIVTAYVTGKNVINWESELASAGLRSAKDGFRIKLSVVDKPSGKQKDLLDKLGYNQWRKLLK